VQKAVSREQYWINACGIRERRPIPRSLEIVGNDRCMVISRSLGIVAGMTKHKD